MTDPLVGIAEGAERSRRAAWAKYYATVEELDRWRDPDTGRLITYATCPCCPDILEIVITMGADGYHNTQMHHLGGENLESGNDLDPVEWARQ